MDQEYETMSPPTSPGNRSASSSQLSARQYFCVNLSKFVIEMTGTALFTIFFYMFEGRYSSLLLALWVITLFGMNISGAHYNPCISLAQMIRRSSSFGRRRLLGIMYLVGQLMGGILGACAVATLLKEGSNWRINVMPSAKHCEYKGFGYNNTGLNFTETSTSPSINCAYDIPSLEEDVDAMPNDLRKWKTFESIVSETFGTFFYVLFFMICTDDKLKYSSDQVKNALVISSSFIASQCMGGGQFVTMRTGPCLNPATAFGLALFQANFDFPQYLICPFVGCLCSVVFYEFVFVKTQEYLNDDDEEGDDDQLEEDADEDEDVNKSGKIGQKNTLNESSGQTVLSDD